MKALRVFLALAALLPAAGAQAQTDLLSGGGCTEELRSLLYAGASANELRAAYRAMYACQSAPTCPYSEPELDYLQSCDDYPRLERLSRELAAQRGAPQLGPELAAKAAAGCSSTQLEAARSKGLFLSRFVDPDGDEGPKPGRCISTTELTHTPAPGSEPPKDAEGTALVPRSGNHLRLSTSWDQGVYNDKRTVPGTGAGSNSDVNQIKIGGELSLRLPLITFKDSVKEPWGPLLAAESGHRYFTGVVADPGGSGALTLSLDGKDVLDLARLKAGHLSIMVRQKDGKGGVDGSWDATYEFLPIDALVLEKDRLMEASKMGAYLGLVRLKAKGTGEKAGLVVDLDAGATVGKSTIQSYETGFLPHLKLDLGLGMNLKALGDLWVVGVFDFEGEMPKDGERVAQNFSHGIRFKLEDIGRTDLGLGLTVESMERTSNSDYEKDFGTAGSAVKEHKFLGFTLEATPRFGAGPAESGL